MFEIRRLMLVLAVIGAGQMPPGPPGRGMRPVAVAAHYVAAAPAVESARQRLPELGPLTSWESAALGRLYAARGGRALWTTLEGTPTEDAREAVTVLAEAGQHGLTPSTYAAEALRRRLDAIAAAGGRSAGDAAEFDALLSAAVLRFLRHLHIGRVDPAAIGLRLHAPAERHDIAALLAASAGVTPLGRLVDDLVPPLQQYRALQVTLAAYRRLLSREPDRFTLDSTAPIDLRAAPHESHEALTQRLTALGDFPKSEGPGSGDDLPLVTAIEQFQRRHGLEPDAIVGARTRAALLVPLSWRVRQIELSLERLRWLPDLAGGRVIGLNIPMFSLSAWDAIRGDAAPAFSTRAIVGEAARHETPVFVDDVREIIFRPFWNVPRSILMQEIVPALRRDPGYLRREQMELVDAQTDDVLDDVVTPAVMQQLRDGTVRVRQRPGPNNALGLIKFSFPNLDSVYLHATPANALFSRSRRDFSHGCVRVEDGRTLAEWVLAGRPEWTRARIGAALSTGPDNQTVRVTPPVQIVLFYLTAAIDPADGTLRFAEDIYRQDPVLDRALSQP